VQVPTLAPYLDLSLVQTVTYIDDKHLSFFFYNWFYPDEKEYQEALSYEGWEVYIPYRLLPPGDLGPIHPPLAVQSLHVHVAEKSESFIWPYFDPVHLCLEGGPPDELGFPLMSYLSLNFYFLRRLRQITVKDLTDRGCRLFRSEKEWFRHGPVSITFESTAEVVDSSTYGIAKDAWGPKNGKTANIDRILIKVRTEEIKKVILDEIADSPLLDRTTIIVKPAEANA
jgi:hypothetical protein